MATAPIFDDESDMTPEELALLRNDNYIPPRAEDDTTVGDTPPGDPTAAQPGNAAQPPADGQPAVAADPAKDGQPADAGDNDPNPADSAKAFEDFVAKHKDRTPEELLKLAFQQDQARRAHYGEAKQAKQQITAISQRMQQALEATRQRQQAEKERHEQLLKEDPDAASRLALDARHNAELEAQEAAQWQSFVAEQTRLAQSLIPEFDQAAPQMLRAAVDAFGYEEQAVRAVSDARDLNVLDMATRFYALMQQGVIDRAGRVVANVAMAAPGAPASVADPRLAAPAAPRTLSNAGGRGGAPVKSLKDQAAEAALMSDADFDAIPEAQLEAMLRAISGGGQ